MDRFFFLIFSILFLTSQAKYRAVKTAGVNVGTTSVVVAPENENRKGFIVFNNSANTVYLSLADTSVASSCTKPLATYQTWEIMSDFWYTGPISAIRNSGSGVVTVWEFLPP